MVDGGTARFCPGDGIAWRNCVRVSPAGGYHPSYAIEMTVVHDRPGDLALYRGPGYPMRRRNADPAAVLGFRHQPVTRFLEGWSTDSDWASWRVLVLMNPEAHHAVSLFWSVRTEALDFWYIDIIGPAERRSGGFDFAEHGLDVIVSPDLSSWEWKDADELEWSVREGRYTRAEADALYKEGRRAVAALQRDSRRFSAWMTWQPDPNWKVPALPTGWDQSSPLNLGRC